MSPRTLDASAVAMAVLTESREKKLLVVRGLPLLHSFYINSIPSILEWDGME